LCCLILRVYRLRQCRQLLLCRIDIIIEIWSDIKVAVLVELMDSLFKVILGLELAHLVIMSAGPMAEYAQFIPTPRCVLI
jgi:hypothetical protein